MALPEEATPHGRVLLVEDDASLRQALAGLIEAHGLDCGAFASAEALLARGTADGDVCIVSDLQLPGMSGLALLDAVRSRGGWPPLILITAHDRPGRAEEAARHGAAGYLDKPFEGAALLQAIRNAIGSRPAA